MSPLHGFCSGPSRHLAGHHVSPPLRSDSPESGEPGETLPVMENPRSVIITGDWSRTEARDILMHLAELARHPSRAQHVVVTWSDPERWAQKEPDIPGS